jgi:chorismate dehydratase
VTLHLKRRIRMAAIHFLNPAPLMWDFEHEPRRSVLRERYQIGYTTPSRCARELAAGEADIGLVPVAAHATTPSLLIVPGCAIAALDRVRSIILVIRSEQGVSAVRTVAADTSSRTSYAYARILFNTFWKVPAVFVPHPPVLESMLAVADAALLIGDPALLALEDREAREARTGERLLYLDLAASGIALPGYPGFQPFGRFGRGRWRRPGSARRT